LAAVDHRGELFFQLVPLGEDDDLIDRLLEHNPAFRRLLEQRLNVAQNLQSKLSDWQDSVLRSLTGADYTK